mmetsp:Transcript_23210/g.37115  ORF Transcript_23210/g.37115 Transcript_23210/m.37115 type:complete len:424 (+) Transcript_23210:71-1342(+)
MEQKQSSTPGSGGSVGGGFRTGASPRCPQSKENVIASMAEPVRKLHTTPDLVIENSVDYPILSFSHTVPDERLPTAETGFAERLRVHFPENVEPQRRAVSNSPLQVDARCTRGNTEEDPANKADANFPECATLRGMNLEGAWPEKSCNDGWQSPAHPPWPENNSGGGATCSGPPHTARRWPAPAHEAMGEVLLLGSGLRVPQSVRAVSSTAAPDKSKADVLTTKLEAQEKTLTGAGMSVVMSKNVVSKSQLDALSGIGKMYPRSEAKLTDASNKRGSQEACKSGRKSLSGDCPKSKSLPSPKLPRAEKELLQETAIEAVIEKHDIGLQTDASPRGCCFSDSLLEGVSAENRRILLLQRCDPKQVDLTSWIPLPKPIIPIPAEMQYLAHVRKRFPGTVDRGCCLEAPLVTRRNRAVVTPRRTAT